MEYSFEKVDYSSFQETSIEEFPEKSIFTTLDWYEYLQKDSKVIPVIIRIYKDRKPIGYFYGGEIRKFGVKILASPFGGWSTCWMGFEVVKGENKYDILKPLWNYLSKQLKYMYCEIIDRDFEQSELERRGWYCDEFPSLELRIDRTDEELFKTFKTDCRNFIRQFERRGASIEVAEGNEAFAEEFYDQLRDVFAKQGLAPSYSLSKVKTIMRVFGKTDKILCLRVRNPEGKSIATGIFFGFHTKCFFWGGASYREHQHYRPNEYVIWTAIRYWREKGCKIMDMAGYRPYKEKFGPVPVSYARVFLTNYPLLISGRNLAKKAYWFWLKVKRSS